MINLYPGWLKRTQFSHSMKFHSQRNPINPQIRCEEDSMKHMPPRGRNISPSIQFASMMWHNYCPNILQQRETCSHTIPPYALFQTSSILAMGYAPPHRSQSVSCGHLKDIYLHSRVRIPSSFEEYEHVSVTPKSFQTVYLFSKTC